MTRSHVSLASCVLRLRDDVSDREAWRPVYCYLARQAREAGVGEPEDIAAEAALRVVRGVGGVHQDASLAEAGAWLRAVWRSTVVDQLRRRELERVAQRVEWESHGARGHSRRIRRVVQHARWGATDGPEPPRESVAQVLDAVEAHADERDRMKVRASLLRVILRYSASELRAETGAPSDSAAYKWVERGRRPAQDAAWAWAGSDEWACGVAGVIVDMLRQRRADAGQPRPERRAS